MTSRTILLTTASVGAALALAATAAAQFAAGSTKVAFPADYAKGVLYATLDRPDLKFYRELYANPESVAAAKRGEPLPYGSVITMVSYKAKLDAAGVPLKDGNGRFIKDGLAAYGVMEKRVGWGAWIAPEIRNGEWEYQAFKADRSINDKANLQRCYECHKPLEPRLDFVFSYDKLAGK
jgi:hypothetical protein